MTAVIRQPIGRFAPSPTGPLHFGSLVTALASFLNIKARGGLWLVRMEDLDPPREVPGAQSEILTQLAAHGLVSDRVVLKQSESIERYEAALERLIDQAQIYACDCPRKRFVSHYPGYCRDRGLALESVHQHALRFRIQAPRISLKDGHLGNHVWHPNENLGDFIVKRRDQLIAYQLAVVVDDIYQGVTEVVRGADLLDSTPYQLALYQALSEPPPQFWHFPVVLGSDGSKLSKQTGAPAVEDHQAIQNLNRALEFLGQATLNSQDIPSLLESAITAWDPRRVPRLLGRT